MIAILRRIANAVPAFALFLAVGAALGWVVSVAYGTGGAARGPSPPVAVEVARVEPRESVALERRFAGRVEPGQESRAGFEISGTVTSVAVREGDRVAAGEPLARLDTARLEAERAAAEADIADAEARLWLARRTLSRRRDAGTPAFSNAAVDEAEEAARRAEAALARAEAALGRIEVDLGKSRLTAPYDGIVLERRIDAGDIATPGAPVLVLLEAGKPEVRIGLTEDAARTLEAGARRQIEIEGRRHEARLRAVLPRRDRTARTVDAIFALDADWSAVNTGDLARLSTTRELAAEGSWVPLSALTESARGLFAVYVAAEGADGPVAERREVEVIHERATRAFVSGGGLAAGERVVSRGVHKLAPGMALRIEPQDGAGDGAGGAADGASVATALPTGRP